MSSKAIFARRHLTRAKDPGIERSLSVIFTSGEPRRYPESLVEAVHNCALRTDYARRQALIEIDVLVARAFGMTLKPLKAIYRLQGKAAFLRPESRLPESPLPFFESMLTVFHNKTCAHDNLEIIYINIFVKKKSWKVFDLSLF